MITRYIYELCCGSYEEAHLTGDCNTIVFNCEKLLNIIGYKMICIELLIDIRMGITYVKEDNGSSHIVT